MWKSLSILCHYADAKRNFYRWRRREDLESWQSAKVQKHLNRILPLSEFYRQRYAGKNLADWENFPVVSKAELMASFGDWNTVGISSDKAFEIARNAEKSRNFVPTIDNITVGLSSGTSGSRGLFLVSHSESCAWAGYMLAKILPDNLLANHRAALCFQANSNLYSTIKGRRIRFAFFDMLKPIEQTASELQTFKPTLLVAPPAMLRLLAEQIFTRNLDIRPARIFSIAEVLEPEERTFIEKIFDQPLHQIYQATEGFIATTCAHGILHLNEDLLVVQKEWLDKKERKFVPVITDFHRKTQPFIRYRLNDILTERKTACPCGSIFTPLEKIEGRCDDLLWMPSLKGGDKIPVFPDFIRRAVMLNDETIIEYEVVLRAGNKMEIALEVNPQKRGNAENSIREKIEQLCKTLGCLTPEISFAAYSTPSLIRKRRRVHSLQSEPVIT